MENNGCTTWQPPIALTKKARYAAPVHMPFVLTFFNGLWHVMTILARRHCAKRNLEGLPNPASPNLKSPCVWAGFHRVNQSKAPKLSYHGLSFGWSLNSNLQPKAMELLDGTKMGGASPDCPHQPKLRMHDSGPQHLHFPHQWHVTYVPWLLEARASPRSGEYQCSWPQKFFQLRWLVFPNNESSQQKRQKKSWIKTDLDSYPIHLIATFEHLGDFEVLWLWIYVGSVGQQWATPILGWYIVWPKTHSTHLQTLILLATREPTQESARSHPYLGARYSHCGSAMMHHALRASVWPLQAWHLPSAAGCRESTNWTKWTTSVHSSRQYHQIHRFAFGQSLFALTLPKVQTASRTMQIPRKTVLMYLRPLTIHPRLELPSRSNPSPKTVGQHRSVTLLRSPQSCTRFTLAPKSFLCLWKSQFLCVSLMVPKVLKDTSPEKILGIIYLFWKPSKL